MSQLGLFLKEEGMEKARTAADVQTWKQRFTDAVLTLVARRPGLAFTSEEIIDMVGLPREDSGMNANNAVGAMMNALAKRGFIRKTTMRRKCRRASSHGREVAVWMAAENGL